MSLTSYRAAPPRVIRLGVFGWLEGGPARLGDDLLFRALRRSTIGAEGFHGRVRDGIGCFAPRYGHQAVQALRVRGQISEIRDQKPAVGFPVSVSDEASCAGVFWRGLPPWLSALLAQRLSPRRNQ